VTNSFVKCMKFLVLKLDITTLLWTNPITEGLRYGAHFHGITQFYLPPMSLARNGINHTCLCLLNRSWSSFTDPGRMEGWVSLGTTMASKQSAQDCYVTKITVISCSEYHASPGNWKRSQLWASNSRPLGPKVVTPTHYVTESPTVYM